MDAPTVTTGEALERAVIDSPGEDTPRLALADFLDENASEVVCPECKGEGKTSHRSADASWIPSFAYKMECSRCYGRGRVPDGRAARSAFIRKSIAAYHDDAENGWTMQPHLHHPRKELFVVPDLAPDRYLYRRGFIADVTFTADSLDALPPVLAAHPVETVRVGEATVRVVKSSDLWWRGVLYPPPDLPRDALVLPTRAALVAGLVPWLRERLG